MAGAGAMDMVALVAVGMGMIGLSGMALEGGAVLTMQRRRGRRLARGRPRSCIHHTINGVCPD